MSNIKFENIKNNPLLNYTITDVIDLSNGYSKISVIGPKKTNYYLHKIYAQYYNINNDLSNNPVYKIYKDANKQPASLTKHKIIYFLYNKIINELIPFTRIHGKQIVKAYLKEGYPMIRGGYGYAIKYNYIESLQFTDNLLDINPF